jgi:type II secretory pathway component PulC
MAQQNLTPEEKLLRIIETPGGPPRGLHARPRASFDWKITLKLLQVKYGALITRFLTFKAANTALVALAAAATLFLLIDFLVGAPRASSLQRVEAGASSVSLTDLGSNDIKPVSVYLQDITERNIFALTPPPPPPVSATTAAAAPASNPAVDSITTSLRVAGILWSSNPQAIMEDTKKNTTTLVSRGSTVMGARVKEVLKDHVVLSYDGKDIEVF